MFYLTTYASRANCTLYKLKLSNSLYSTKPGTFAFPTRTLVNDKVANAKINRACPIVSQMCFK